MAPRGLMECTCNYIYINVYIPEDPCKVYFPTFSTKSQPNVGKYTNRPMDPMGICVYCIHVTYIDLSRMYAGRIFGMMLYRIFRMQSWKGDCQHLS